VGKRPIFRAVAALLASTFTLLDFEELLVASVIDYSSRNVVGV
jgi:hypothetical protein